MDFDVLGTHRVVEDCSSIGAAYVGRILSDLGADVIKCEPLAGDSARSVMAESDGLTGTFMYVNAGKRSIALTRESEVGREVLSRLLGIASIVIVDEASELLGSELAARLNPDAIVAAVTGFGLSGPRSGERLGDRGLFHEAGASIVDIRSDMQGNPPLAPRDVAGYDGGMAGALAVLATLLGRQIGNGYVGRTVIDVSIQEAVASLMRQDLCAFPNEGISISPRTQVMAGPFGTLMLECSDGLILTHVGSREWPDWCNAIGRSDEASRPLFRERGERVEDIAHATRVISEWTKSRTKAAVERHVQRFGIAAGSVQTSTEVLRDEQLHVRGFFGEVTVGETNVSVPASLPFIERKTVDEGVPTRLRSARSAAPRIGGDTISICGELGYSEDDVQLLLRQGAIRCS